MISSFLNGLVSVALLMASQELEETASQVYVDPASRAIRDPEGRQLIFHGVNVVYKLPPYVPTHDKESPFDMDNSLNHQDMTQLTNWGMNFVRLGVIWEAVEVAPGQYNQTYLDDVEKLINQLGAQGIYTMVDSHQDVMSRLVCGEGMPDFYAREVIKDAECGDWSSKDFDWLKKIFGTCRSIESYNYTKDAQGRPLIADCNKEGFFKYYTTAESLAIFDALYNDHHDLQTRFVAYWEVLANKFANNKYVIGFDPLNEPFPAGFENDTSLLKPGQFDKRQLAPLYARIHEKYMAANPKSINYFETGQYPDSYQGYVFDAGFTTPPGGNISSPNHVLNDHSYCCQLDTHMCDSGEPNVNKSKECSDWHGLRIQTREKNAKSLGVPLIISEFGACYGSDVCAREITQVADECDKVLAGWAYWQFKYYADLTTTAGTGSEGFYNKDGSLQDKKVKALSRTYMQRTQGTLTKMDFNSSSSLFIAEFKLDASIEAPSQLYMNQKYWYQGNYKLYFYDKATSKLLKPDKMWDENKTHFFFWFKNKQLHERVIGVKVVKYEPKDDDAALLY